MNNQRTEKIKNCISLLDQVKIILEELWYYENDAFHNLPESLRDTEKGEKMRENIYIMEAQNEALDDVIAELEEAL